MRLMIFGAGFSGRGIGKRAQDTCEFVGGTTRQEDNFSRLHDVGITPFQFSGKEFSSQLTDELKDVTHLIQSISPDKGGDPLLPLIENDLQTIMPNLKWVGYLSTVGVYGNHDGEWVDEKTTCKPVSKRSIARLEAENAWAELCDKHDLTLAILRLSGIYGQGRNTFVNYEKGKARRLVKQDQVFNRIFVDDIARAAELLMTQNAGGIFNITDDEPAPPQDVVAYAAELLGVEPPPEIDFETADLTPMARSFYGENKRVSNRKIKSLGFEFSQPNYRAALTYLYEKYHQ